MAAFEWDGEVFDIQRYPETSNKSLKSWNSGDELVLDWIKENDFILADKLIFHDRFCFLSSVLENVDAYFEYASQLKAHEEFAPYPLEESYPLSIIRIPKSIELLEEYILKTKTRLAEGGTVLFSFMTKYFTPTILELVNKHFGVVEQSLAKKKARLIIAKSPTDFEGMLPKEINFNGRIYQQLRGVFSSSKIDHATQWLLEDFKVLEQEKSLLDLACGNGVIAHSLELNSNFEECFLLDDSKQAIESSRLNCKGSKFHFIWDDRIPLGLKVDLIVSNPPFHLDHENNIEVSLALFKQAKKALNKGGRFVVVANKHLNYSTHLEKSFVQVNVLKENKKFEVLECKP